MISSCGLQQSLHAGCLAVLPYDASEPLVCPECTTWQGFSMTKSHACCDSVLISGFRNGTKYKMILCLLKAATAAATVCIATKQAAAAAVVPNMPASSICMSHQSLLLCRNGSAPCRPISVYPWSSTGKVECAVQVLVSCRQWIARCTCAQYRYDVQGQ